MTTKDSADFDAKNALQSWLSATDQAASTPQWAARRKLAAALRELTETLVTTTSEADALNAASREIKALNARLNQAPRLNGRKAFETAPEGRYGNWPTLSLELSPIEGRSNPLAPPLKIWLEDGVGHGRARLGWAYEGPPDTVHGGFVCALLDHFLGITQILTGQPGVTGALNVRFHQPTPLNCELELRGQLKEVRGRHNILRGEIHAQGRLTASCEAVFVHVSAAHLQKLREQR